LTLPVTAPAEPPVGADEPRSPRLVRYLRVAMFVVLAALLAAVLVVFGTAVRVWQVARQDHRPVSDAIVVLGSAQYDGRPSPILRARLDHAIVLYRQGVAPRIVTVGGNRAGDRYTEAGAGATYLRNRGLPASAVLAVEQGSDTLESVRAVAVAYASHGWHTAVLVTDPWHVLRTQRMARDSGIDAVGSPTRSGPVVQTRQIELRYVARETAAYLYYRILHRGTESGPPVS